MTKKYTKMDLFKVMSEAVQKESEDMRKRGMGGEAGLAITLIGMSIMNTTLESLFEDTDEIEIIDTKE